MATLLGMTSYASNKILDHIVGKAAFSMPTIYVALSTTVPTEEGTNFTEPTSNYTRIETDDTYWYSAENSSISNIMQIIFPEAEDSWGTITYVGIYDAMTEGNLLCGGELSSPITVLSGDTVRFVSEALIITQT